MQVSERVGEYICAVQRQNYGSDEPVEGAEMHLAPLRLDGRRGAAYRKGRYPVPCAAARRVKGRWGQRRAAGSGGGGGGAAAGVDEGSRRRPAR